MHDDPRARRDPPTRQVLRGGTLVTAPLVLIGLVLLAVGLVNLAWSVSNPGSGSAWTETIVFAVLGVVFLTASAGCRLVVRSGQVSDQLAFVTIRSIPQGDIAEVRTRAGLWRTFEIETTDGRRRVLLGCGPLQFPSTLMPDAAERDLARIDTITGSVRS